MRIKHTINAIKLCNLSRVLLQKSFYPIQTINVTSRTIDSVKQILVFSKGVNINMLNKLFNSNWSSYYQPIKEKCLEIRPSFYADSTVVKTIDGNGFTLNFPNNYGTIGSYRTIGKNKKQSFLKARLKHARMITPCKILLFISHSESMIL